MTDRARALARMVALQTRARGIAAARLAQAEAARAEVVAARAALQLFIDEGGLTGRLAVMAGRQSHGLAEREARAEARRQTLTAALQAAETRLRLAERMGEQVAREARDAAERGSLERLIEDLIGSATPPR